jgi:hypothetical protein
MEIAQQDIDSLRRQLQGHTITQLVQECSNRQRHVSLQHALLDALDELVGDHIALDIYDSLPPTAGLREYVMLCIVRNGRLRTESMRTLLMLWKKFTVLQDAVSSRVCEHAVYDGLDEMLRHEPTIDCPEDVDALREMAGDLDALFAFEHRVLPAGNYHHPNLVAAVGYLAKIKQALKREKEAADPMYR